MFLAVKYRGIPSFSGEMAFPQGIGIGIFHPGQEDDDE